MTFRYFRSRLRDIHSYSVDQKCAFCSRIRPSIRIPADRGSRGSRYCCLSCLAAGCSSIPQTTEIGFVEGGSLLRYDTQQLKTVEIAPPAGFRVAALAEIGHNPWFRAQQEAIYLVHCNDFMAYIGRWEPADFARGDADPRSFYIETADGDPQLWDDTERERLASQRWPRYKRSHWAYGSWCYVFKCLTCSRLRSSWDCT